MAPVSFATNAAVRIAHNGWIEWKAANGKTLDEVKRQSVSLEASALSTV